MSDGKVIAVAHRGASAYAPENTVAAFDEAVRLHAKAVEFDIQLSADGAIVVIHDETLQRTTNGRGRVKDYQLFDLLRLDAGSWLHPRFAGTRIPTLDEALLAIGPHALPVLELKAPIPGALLLQHLQRYDLLDDCLVISFRPQWLLEVRKHTPKIPLGLLSDRFTHDLPARAKALDADVLLLSTEALSPESAHAANAEGLELWCYTANDIGLVAACASLGTTGIITDKPDLIRSREDK